MAYPKQMLRKLLLAWVNLAYYQELMSSLRGAIADGRFDDAAAGIKDAWARARHRPTHPGSLRETQGTGAKSFQTALLAVKNLRPDTLSNISHDDKPAAGNRPAACNAPCGKPAACRPCACRQGACNICGDSPAADNIGHIPCLPGQDGLRHLR
jgi:hypothetical protein